MMSAKMQQLALMMDYFTNCEQKLLMAWLTYLVYDFQCKNCLMAVTTRYSRYFQD
jgi:hypothetical protein